MSAPSLQRTIALCYVRRSMTRNPEDYISPERQMDNIRLLCEQHGWTPEWYTDVKGHKSGREEKNRPGWLALKNRLADPDVVALVANDLSRLHRSGWRINDLFDLVDNHNLRLVMADPAKPLDLSTPEGRVSAHLEAIYDEWYSLEIGQHLKSSIEHRKRKGVTIGLPPFGTVRDSEGYLIPSPEGAWLMPGGTFQQGTPDESPHPQAIWRSYYEAAERILRMYVETNYGTPSIAVQMNKDGWPMRDRWGNPKLMNADDIRRVIANWPEYGGYVSVKRARERDPRECNPDTVQLNPERAVFPIDLLIQVGKFRQRHAEKYGSESEQRAPKQVYSLSGLLYCHHCELVAQKHDNPRLRSRLIGNSHNKWYAHKEGVDCGCLRRSVTLVTIEGDFARLLNLLTVPMDKIDFARLHM